MIEGEPLLQTFYLYCDLHGLIKETPDMEEAIEWQEIHEESTDGFCTVSITTTKQEFDKPKDELV